MDRVSLQTGLADPIQVLFTPTPVIAGGIIPASRRQQTTDKPGLSFGPAAQTRLLWPSPCRPHGRCAEQYLHSRALAEAPQLPLPPNGMSVMPSAGLWLGPGVRNWKLIPQNVQLPPAKPRLLSLLSLPGVSLTLLNHSFSKPVLY